MDSTAAQVTRFEGIMLQKHMLNSDIPLNRVRQLLVVYVTRGCRASVGLRQITTRGYAARENATVGKERGCKDVRIVVVVDSRAELRGIGRRADIIKDNVVSHTEAGTNGRVPAVSGRIRD